MLHRASQKSLCSHVFHRFCMFLHVFAFGRVTLGNWSLCAKNFPRVPVVSSLSLCQHCVHPSARPELDFFRDWTRETPEIRDFQACRLCSCTPHPAVIGCNRSQAALKIFQTHAKLFSFQLGATKPIHSEGCKKQPHIQADSNTIRYCCSPIGRLLMRIRFSTTTNCSNCLQQFSTSLQYSAVIVPSMWHGVAAPEMSKHHFGCVFALLV